ncbi:MAG TPA: hypothetical protein ENJ35_07590 [Gammaproteobacteria bacterium]|nr:hypothetical protein [Gammaproteobacteria bacterium]
MTLKTKLELARVKMIRYRILKVLDAGRPYPVGDGLLVEVLVDADLNVTQHEIRKALQYLADKGYLALSQPDSAAHWEARLLPQGVDYLENPSHDDPGITRPVEL